MNPLNPERHPTPAGLRRSGAFFVQTKISTRHGHLSDEHQEQIRQKLKRLENHFGRLMMIEVIVDVANDDKHVEVLVSAEHKHDFVATESAKELGTAVDRALDRVDQQLRKYKERIQDHRHTPPMSGEPKPPK
jgi:ribosome hibernation promoting factor